MTQAVENQRRKAALDIEFWKSQAAGAEAERDIAKKNKLDALAERRVIEEAKRHLDLEVARRVEAEKASLLSDVIAPYEGVTGRFVKNCTLSGPEKASRYF